MKKLLCILALVGGALVSCTDEDPKPVAPKPVLPDQEVYGPTEELYGNYNFAPPSGGGN